MNKAGIRDTKKDSHRNWRTKMRKRHLFTCLKIQSVFLFAVVSMFTILSVPLTYADTPAESTVILDN